MTWTAYYANTTDAFGTLASPTRTSIATGTFTVTSTLTQYTTNISMPANAINGVEIVFTVGAQTSGTWTIGSVQLEKGSTATSFDYRPYGTELALCQRYYANNYYGIQGAYYSTTQWICYARNGVQMRASPTITLSSGTTITLDSTLGAPTVTPTFDYSNVMGFRVFGTPSSSASIGIPAGIISTNIQASAEL